MIEDLDKVDIFWTGGWDSTFRLLQLLLTSDKIVQPHYIIRNEEVTGVEIHVMNLIRREIAKRYSDISSRFLPTHYANGNTIEKFVDVEEQVEELRKTIKVNDQYRLMANYCYQFKIKEIEVALDKTPGVSAKEWLDEHFKGIHAFDMFNYPVFHLTKFDMYKIAKEKGWLDILDLTSFCRRPHIKIEPCGTCGACIDTVISGMGFRLPLMARIKAKIQIPFRKYWRENYNSKKNTKLFRFIERKFINKF